MSDAEVKIPVEAETEGKASTDVLKPVPSDTAKGEDKGNSHVVITVPSVTAAEADVLKPVGDTAAEAQLKEEAAEWISQQRKFLMIVAVVVAISTFRAGISQKGFWPDSRDGHLAGESVFRSVYPRSFSYFMLCTGVSFFTSVLMLLCLAHDRFYGTPIKMVALNIIGMVDLGLLVPAFIFGAFPEKPSDGLSAAYGASCMLSPFAAPSSWLYISSGLRGRTLRSNRGRKPRGLNASKVESSRADWMKKNLLSFLDH